jgi:hypothetical protein
MANDKNLTPFQVGNPGGPGRPKDPPEIKLIKQMTRGEFSLLIHKLIDLKPEELKDFKGTVLEMAMASIIQQAIKHGDPTRLQFFVERLFGKVKTEIEHSGSLGLTEAEIDRKIAEIEAKDKK